MEVSPGSESSGPRARVESEGTQGDWRSWIECTVGDRLPRARLILIATGSSSDGTLDFYPKGPRFEPRGVYPGQPIGTAGEKSNP